MKDIKTLVVAAVAVMGLLYALTTSAVVLYCIWCLALHFFSLTPSPGFVFGSVACVLCFGWGLAAGQKHPKK